MPETLSEHFFTWTGSNAQIGSLAATFSATIALLSAIIALLTLRLLRQQLGGLNKQAEHEAKSFQAQMLLQLSAEWTRILPKRYFVINQLQDENSHLRFTAGQDGQPRPYHEFFNDTFWRDNLRAVLNFYENLGLLIARGYIAESDAFVIVSVDTFEGREKIVENASFYRMVKPVLQYLRTGYREDIYVFYDRWLLRRYCEHKPLWPECWTPEAEESLLSASAVTARKGTAAYRPEPAAQANQLQA